MSYNLFPFLQENASLIVSTLGLLISLITLCQVSSMKKAQKHYDELIETDKAKDLLQDVSDYMEGNISSCNELTSLQSQISSYIGNVEGVKKTLNIKRKRNKEDDNPFVQEGYYSTDFLLKIIDTTKNKLDIVAKRNMRISHMDNLHKMGKLLDENKQCIIRLMAVSPDTDDKILTELNKTIPIPAENTAELKKELIENRNKIINFKNNLPDSAKNRFFYYEYLGFPPFHFVRSDNLLHFGLVNFHKERHEFDVTENRPYLKLKINKVALAKKLVGQFEKFVQDCEKHKRFY